MRKGIEVRLGRGDRERLEAVIGSEEQPAEARVAGSDRSAERYIRRRKRYWSRPTVLEVAGDSRLDTLFCGRSFASGPAAHD